MISAISVDVLMPTEIKRGCPRMRHFHVYSPATAAHAVAIHGQPGCRRAIEAPGSNSMITPGSATHACAPKGAASPSHAMLTSQLARGDCTRRHHVGQHARRSALRDFGVAGLSPSLSFGTTTPNGINLKTAAAMVVRAPAAGLAGRISLRFGCKCRPTMWPTGRSLAAAPQLALHDGLPHEQWRSSIL